METEDIRLALNTLVVVCTRIAGLFMLLYAIQSAGGAILVIATGNTFNPYALLVLVPAALITLASVLLIVWPRTVAGTLLPNDTPAETPMPITYADLVNAACLLLGLYFLVSGVLDAIYWISWYQMSLERSLVWSPRVVASLIRTLAELIAGLWLIFGAKGIGELVRRARSA